MLADCLCIGFRARRQYFKQKKSAQRGSFRDVRDGCPVDIRGSFVRTSLQDLWNPGKASMWVQTSMTQRRVHPRPEGVSKNFSQIKFGLIFRSLIPSAQKHYRTEQNVFCISLISCNALHEEKKHSQIYIFHVIFFLGWNPGINPENFHMKKHLRILLFLSRMGLHDRTKTGWEFIW